MLFLDYIWLCAIAKGIQIAIENIPVMASEEKIATAVVSIVNSDHAEPNKIQENQIEKAPEVIS